MEERPMRALPEDGKTLVGYQFWNSVNKLVLAAHFVSLKIIGRENLPASEPFVLVANHSSRWDGPMVQNLLDRRSNYMVSPNEMKGLQGSAVRSVGAFPASPRFDLVGHCLRQLERGEPVVVFPEGNVFYDGIVHPFKKATARIALVAAEKGLPLKIVPVGIAYNNPGMPRALVNVGEAIPVPDYVDYFADSKRDAVEGLTFLMNASVRRLHQEARDHGLGSSGKHALLSGV
ncbi:MAG: 1-acyl-sn-glycerol-3-phosphate acyltransferase [Cyanobacteria bacterium HKST-UBA02]|nr:1-acyl-sn-glycerol-3-phosphate acyltransferase [Cyanobacteria bacterium HKST-UBA02]